MRLGEHQADEPTILQDKLVPSLSDSIPASPLLPSLAMDESNQAQKRAEAEITKLKNKRTGMKGGITKRINHIKKMVNKRDSLSGVTYLLGKLSEVVDETRSIANVWAACISI